MAELDPQFIEQMRQARDANAFTLFDTMFIGQGAGAADPGWYNNFQDFAIQDSIQFFQGRRSNSLAWTNQPGERRDWQFKAQFISLEFFALYPSLGAYLSQPLDADFYPALWAQLCQSMSMQIAMGDAADIVWQSPLSFVPTSSAPTGTRLEGVTAPSTTIGTNGVAIKKNNSLPFPGGALDIPAKSKINMTLQIGAQMKQFLSETLLPPPGSVQIPTAAGPVTRPQWYGCRIIMHGIRFVQIRGAMSSA